MSRRTPSLFVLAVLLGPTQLAAGCDGAPPEDGGVAGPCASDEACDDGRFCNGAERCLPEDTSADARGCATAEALPCQEEALECFELEGRCRTLCDVTPDADGDGVPSLDCGGTDCADDDPGRFPGNLETCDFAGHDEDCDLETFGSDRDVDGDGSVDDGCTNTRFEDGMTVVVSRGADCDDLRAFVAPGQAEECNGRDDDCDGEVDEGVTVDRYVDADGDGDGVAGSDPVQVCPGDTGTADTATDCDDTTPLFRGAPWFELCDDADNDCDGTTDEDPRAVAWYLDADEDGFGDAEAAVMVSCAPIPGRSLLGTDCDDTRPEVHPGSPELCDGRDDDCNGRLDYRDAAEGFFEDEDGDGVPHARCAAPGDCDDTDFFSGGDAPELCADLADNDCDGMVDEAGAEPVPWYADLDGDGWGDESGGVVATQCERLPRASFRVHDCDDSAPRRHPFAPDLCDGVDVDCDGALDEDAPHRVVFLDVDGDGAGVETEPRRVCGRAPPGFAELPRDCAPADRTLRFRWVDGDGDGLGGGEPLLSCAGGVPLGGDCDDGDPAVTSGCVERCNGADDDGDGSIDEAGPAGCPAAASTTWTCDAGACVFGGCASGAMDCDGDAANGCEDSATDPLHCGGCGVSCGVGADCVARSCASQVIDVSVDVGRSCVLRDNGRVACWGALPPGLPLGTSDRPTPDTLLREGAAPIADASWLEVGRTAWCVGRATDGAMRCASGNGVWDLGAYGTPMTSPLTRSLPSGLTAIAIRHFHGCGIGAGGRVVCWGLNAAGQLGRGTQSTGQSPPGPVVGLSGATRVDVGEVHSCAVAGGEVYCWGNDNVGRLGSPPSAYATAPVPFPLDGTVTDPALDVACSTSATCVLRSSGTIACSGRVALMTPPGTFSATAPTVIGALPGATAISGGDHHFCVASPSGAYCFGNDNHGVLGDGPGRSDTMVPTRAVGLSSAVAVDVAQTHSCAVATAGEVWCWGLASGGQLGTGTGDLESPGRVLSLP